MTTPPIGNPLFTGLLIFTAKVYRRQRVAAESTEIPEHVDHWGTKEKVDNFRQPTKDEVYSHSLSCRFSTPSGGLQFEERSRDVIQVRGKLFLDAGADLRETDLVTVISPDGVEVVTKAQVDVVNILTDGVAEQHREAVLVTQRAAR